MSVPSPADPRGVDELVLDGVLLMRRAADWWRIPLAIVLMAFGAALALDSMVGDDAVTLRLLEMSFGTLISSHGFGCGIRYVIDRRNWEQLPARQRSQLIEAAARRHPRKDFPSREAN